jgi:hypothetical protein
MPNFIDVMDRLDMMDKKLNSIIRVVEVFIEYNTDEEEEQ